MINSNYYGSPVQNSIGDLVRVLHIEEKSRNDAEIKGVPALHRLFNIAKSNSRQALVIRRFLLGLYDGARFPVNLNSLRYIDVTLIDDALLVLGMDAKSLSANIDDHIAKGSMFFEAWARNAEVLQ